MNIKVNALFLSSVLFSTVTLAEQPCAIPWSLQLDTQHLSLPKAYGDSSNAAYASFEFLPSSGIKLMMKMQFPHAQFMSIQTQTLTTQSGVIFDYQIKPDKGSYNPFIVGTNLNVSPRGFGVELRPNDSRPTSPNSISFDSQSLTVMTMRIYEPSQGYTITQADLPQVYAVDATTLAPAACPSFLPISNGPVTERLVTNFLYGIETNLALLALYQIPPKGFRTSTADFYWGSSTNVGNTNQATTYLLSNNEMEKGRVAVLRLKATPSFAQTYSGTGKMPGGTETRGWSICTMDFQTLYNFGCVPDYLAAKDQNGYVTVVVGLSDAVKKKALASGSNFLPDTRLSYDVNRAPVVSMGFYLRNLLPTTCFAQSKMYRDNYCPSAKICSESEYLSGNCIPTSVGNCSHGEPMPIACP